MRRSGSGYNMIVLSMAAGCVVVGAPPSPFVHRASSRAAINTRLSTAQDPVGSACPCSVPLRTRLFHTTEARLRAVGRAGIDHQFRGPGDVQFGVFDSKFNDPELLKHHVSRASAEQSRLPLH